MKKGTVFLKNNVYFIKYYQDLFDGIFTYPNYFEKEIELFSEFKDNVSEGDEVKFVFNDDYSLAILE